MELGITGLPLTGKTTLFNALTGESVVTGSYSAGQDAHRAVVKVPDARLDVLTRMFMPRRTVPADVRYVDVAGIVKGGTSASRASLLSALRTVDALIHVVRAFRSETVAEPEGGIDPARDIADFDLELALSDLETVERRLERLEKEVRSGRHEGEREVAVLRRCHEALGAETPLRSLDFTPEEARLIRGFQFLTLKPMILVVNVGEGQRDEADRIAAELAPFAKRPHVELAILCAELEMEIAQLDEADQPAFLADLGIDEPALHRLIRLSYHLLDLVSFFTVGSDEVRAWTLTRGETALDAAGTIHTDLARGFIRAEVTSYEDLTGRGSLAAAREHGLLRLEGKGYVVQDGDVITIRFNI